LSLLTGADGAYELQLPVIARLVIVAAAAALAGCAQIPEERPPAPPPAPTASAPTVSRTVGEAIARHRKLADDARRAGDLATAAQQLQVLTVLAPDAAAYVRELATVRASIDKDAREAVQAGVAAMSAGELDRASASMLRALALDPSQADAANALREIDRRRLTRIQADKAAKVAQQGNAPGSGVARAQTEVNDGFDIEQAIEMVRAGDASNGLRDLRAYVAANPNNRAVRQRIGNAVADRARELEDQKAKEQAVSLYEQAVALRGDGNAPWAARMAPLKKALSQDYLDKGTRAYRTNLAQAITFFETSVKYDPQNTAASIKLKEAKTAREKLDKIK
jgi:tetratricopeptide (TPR) repeat protein